VEAVAVVVVVSVVVVAVDVVAVAVVPVLVDVAVCGDVNVVVVRVVTESVVLIVAVEVAGDDKGQHMSAHLSCSSISAISRKSSTALMSNSRACITRGDGGAVTPVTFARWRATSAASPPTASSPRANAKIDTPFSLRSAEAAASARGNDTPRPSEMMTNTGTTLTISPGHSGSKTARQAVLETSPNTRLLTRDNPRCRFVSPPGWVVFRARKTVSSAPPVSRTRGRSRRAPGKNSPRRGDSWREEKVAIANRLPFAMRGTTLLLTALPTRSTAAAH
jgi:hypothetical protein